MSGALSGLSLHFAARLRAVLREPGSLASLVGGALATLLLWPGLTGPGAEGWSPLPGVDLPIDVDRWTVLFWLLLWPIVPFIAAAGRVADSARADAFSQRACPALPVRPRARMAAEALLVLLPVAGVHAARLLLPGAADAAEAFVTFAAGALVALPILLAWTSPSPTVPLLWLRPALVVFALLGAVSLGLLASPLRLAATSATLSAVVLLSAGLDLRPLLELGRRGRLPATAARPALPPARQLRRDFLFEALRRLGPASALLVLLVVAVLVVDGVFPLPPFAFLCVWFVAFGLLAGFALRPAGSGLVPSGFRGTAGARLGDLGRAFAVLPVRPESVRRAAYVHGLVVSLALLGGAVALVASRTWQKTGRFNLVDGEGTSIAPLFALGLCAPPLVAGVAAAATAGHRRVMALSGWGLLGLLNLPGLSFVVVRESLGGSPRTATAVALALVAVLTLVGSLPPLVLLRRERRPT